MRKKALKLLKNQDKAGKKEKAKAIKSQAKEHKAIVLSDDEATVVQAQAIGLIDDTADVNKLVESLKEIKPFYNIDTTEDRIDNQIFAIMLMEGMIREFRGDYLPNFSLAGRMLGRSKSYMYQLWQDRDEITAQKNTILNEGLKMVRVKIIVNLLKMTNALDRMTVEKWAAYFDDAKEMKNFMDFYDKQILRARLLASLSTENIDHHHKHEGKVDFVQTDDM